MLPALTIHLKPMSPSLSARLQTTFALLLPCLWWAPPSWVIPPPHPLVIMSSQPQPCHNSSPPHTFQSGYGVSFTLNPCTLTRPCEVRLTEWQTHSSSDLTLLRQHCDSPALTSPWPFFTFCFFSWDKAVCAIGQCDAPERYHSWREAQMFLDGERVWNTHTKKWLPPLMPQHNWRSHSEVGLEFQTRLCLCCLPEKTD